jgi:hypothetical protein
MQLEINQQMGLILIAEALLDVLFVLLDAL